MQKQAIPELVLDPALGASGVTEASLEHRFKDTARELEPVVYEFTTDRALLHQYYQLREVMYRKVFKTEKFVGKEDVYDKISHILIARRGKLCIGGVRLTVREADEEFQLPMENPDFQLRQLFKDERYCEARHCELSRFAVLSDRFEKDVMYNLSKHMFEKIMELEAKYMFVKSTYAMIRNWRKVANTLGFHENHIFSDINVPENPIHPDVKWFLGGVTMPVPVKETSEKTSLKYLTRVH